MSTTFLAKNAGDSNILPVVGQRVNDKTGRWNHVNGLEGLTTFSMSSLLSYNNVKFRHLGTTFNDVTIDDF